MGDVWQRGEGGELTLHRSLDHFQRERLAANWQPPSTEVLQNRRERFGKSIERLAGQYRVDAKLVRAIIEVESAYDPQAVSKAGAQGLMQLMPMTVERFGVIDPLNPDQNVEGGIRYLQLLIREFQHTELVLAAYNAGEEAVRRFNRQIPPYAETQAYVQRVLSVIQQEEVSGR